MFNEEGKGFGTNVYIEDKFFVIANFNKRFNKKSKILRENKIIKEGEFTMFEPCFEELDSAVYGKVLKTKMWHSVFNQKELKRNKESRSSSIYVVIQWEKDILDETNFSLNHLYTLTLFNSMIGQWIEKIKLLYYRKQVLDTTLSMLDTFKEVAQDKNIASISTAIENYLPKIFRAVKAAIFFKDHSKPNLMYVVTSVGDDKNGIKFIRNYWSFPTSLGYTGYCIQNKRILVYNQNEKNLQNIEANSEIEFFSEVDNFLSVNSIKTAVFGPIVDSYGNVQGALQVINKINDHEKVISSLIYQAILLLNFLYL